MKRKNSQLRLIIATFFVFMVFFLAQPAYATSPIEDPISFIAEIIEAVIEFLRLLVQAFIEFLAQLFGA